MHHQYHSISTGILGVVGEITDMEQSVGARSQTILVLVTSLAFLVPAFTAWRMKRIWHCCLFCVMTAVCTSYHFCTADTPKVLGMSMRCDATTTHLTTIAFFVAIHFCFLQMAFLVFGPEDPHMQWLGTQTGSGSPTSSIPQHAPLDTIVAARIVPGVVLCLYFFLHSSWDKEEIHWQSLLLTELLLLGCSIGFWMHRSRQLRAADVLTRFKYWNRLLHHGLIPAMMLFWICCIMGFADIQALHSMWHVIVALFAASLLRTVLAGDSLSTSAKVFDTTSHNPNVAHVLLGGVALIVLPTAVIGASFDWCSTGEAHWPTISTTTLCQQGGYFVAIVAVPAFVAVSIVFWLIASTSGTKSSWVQFRQAKPWNSHAFERDDWHGSSFNPDSQQLAMGKSLGCLLGNAGGFFGLLAALIMKGTPIRNVLTMFCSIMSLGLIMIAMALTVLSSDPSTRGFHLRRRLTMLVCLPMMVVHMVLLFGAQSSYYQVPHSYCAVTEYIVVLLVALWPLSWVPEVQDTWQRNSSGTFVHPVTPWRFV